MNMVYGLSLLVGGTRSRSRRMQTCPTTSTLEHETLQMCTVRNTLVTSSCVESATVSGSTELDLNQGPKALFEKAVGRFTSLVPPSSSCRYPSEVYARWRLPYADGADAGSSWSFSRRLQGMYQYAHDKSPYTHMK